MTLNQMTDNHLENAMAYSKKKGDARSYKELEKEYNRRNPPKKEEIDLEDTALGYDEWKASGYAVVKGSKSRTRDPLGIPQFMADQVVKKGDRSGKTHWEECADRCKDVPWGVIRGYDSFVREAGMMPDLSRRPTFAINDPLEMHFMNVADKHGVLDAILDGEEDYY
jgi:hypothetical protein